MSKNTLQMDEFHPGKYKEKFFYLPQSIAAMPNLSEGAKLLYGALMTLGQTKGKAFASKAYLQKHLGNPSKSTLYRWQTELKNEGLIRVLQRGRGVSNIYYFLRHPALGNAEVGEFKPGPRPLYRDRKHGTQTIVTEDEGLKIFEDNLRDWLKVNTSGGFMELPKPGIKVNASKRKELEHKYFQMLAAHTISGYEKDEVKSMTKGEVPSIEEVFAKATDDSANNRALTLSDEPVAVTLPTGQVIKGPSPRACYEGEMKRRRENEERKMQIEVQRTKSHA